MVRPIMVPLSPIMFDRSADLASDTGNDNTLKSYSGSFRLAADSRIAPGLLDETNCCFQTTIELVVADSAGHTIMPFSKRQRGALAV